MCTCALYRHLLSVFIIDSHTVISASHQFACSPYKDIEQYPA